MNIHINRQKSLNLSGEFVERKGIGHPDTLADALGEELSVNYSNYTLKKYGVVLHHNFDKTGLLGGASYVTFGKGYLIKPIRVLLNGRASTKFGNEEIPIKEMLISWSKSFLKSKFPNIDPDKDLEFHYNLSNQSSPGKTDEFESTNAPRKHWFEPRSFDDLPELKKLVSNDTSMGVGYAPYSTLENLILNIESKLNSEIFNRENPWIGSDIKIMGFREDGNYSITMCIPQIANYVKNAKDYKNNIDNCRKIINHISSDLGIKNLELYINTRDNYATCELYLTAIGSSIESGDEGLVGRGNRINGVISPMRPMSMEGSCGKNPVYHIGKIYYVTAQKIAERIYKELSVDNEVFLVSQSGRDLLDPWKILVTVYDQNVDDIRITQIVESEITNIPEVTKQILEFKLRMY